MNYKYFFQQLIKRMMVLLFGFFMWHTTQNFLSSDVQTENEIIDRVHDSVIFSGINSYMYIHYDFVRYNLLFSSLLIDLSVAYTSFKYLLYGNNFRTIFIMIAGFMIRQLCQYINRLPIPKNMIWFYPGFPSLLVTYSVQNDFFFSGHTYVALCSGLEIASSKNLFYKLYGILFILYEIFIIISINGHYFMDIYGAISTYYMMNYFYEKLKL